MRGLVITALLLLGQNVYALGPMVKGVTPGTCINSNDFKYEVVQLMGSRNGLFVYEVAGNMASPRGMLKSRKQYKATGRINHSMKYLETTTVTADTGFVVPVDVWEDCK